MKFILSSHRERGCISRLSKWFRETKSNFEPFVGSSEACWLARSRLQHSTLPGRSVESPSFSDRAFFWESTRFISQVKGSCPATLTLGSVLSRGKVRRNESKKVD